MLCFIERNNWIAWVFVFIIGIFIFYTSSRTFAPPTSMGGFPLKAVIYHIGIFFLFTIFLMIATSKGMKIDWVYFSFIFAFFYGVSDEFHQLFVFGRNGSLGDVFLDGIGIVFAFLVYIIILLRRRIAKV